MPSDLLDALRIGQGCDIHRLVSGRPCIIGGVKFDSPVGPDGHSDGDVLLHAIMDALLGAAGLPDIGHRFPPTDMKWRNANSADLLANVWSELRSLGWSVINLDCSIITQLPKIAPRREEIQARIAALLDVSVDRVGLKATTAEQLGALGRGEGIFAQVSALLRRT